VKNRSDMFRLSTINAQPHPIRMDIFLSWLVFNVTNNGAVFTYFTVGSGFSVSHCSLFVLIPVSYGSPYTNSLSMGYFFNNGAILLIFPIFSIWGSPNLHIKLMHTTFFYFNYSTEAGNKPYIDLTNRSHQIKVSKHHQSSTKLEE
jgi:hypothetical protein